jgi:hypothetical protein
MTIVATAYEGHCTKTKEAQNWIIFRKEQGGDPFMFKSVFNSIKDCKLINEELFKK